MKIVVDAMGGDNAPAVPVAGAILAAREYDVPVVLVGQADVIEAQLQHHDVDGLALDIEPASEVIEMEEEPALAARKKRDSSIVVGLELLKAGHADAFFSAGNTGGVLAAAIFYLRRIKGVKRPALSTIFPTMEGHCLLLDVGANAEVRPEYLVQFALMGHLYAERVLGVSRPRLALVSNGEEEIKGTAIVKEAHQRLKALPGLHFVGNVEGKDIPAAMADVVITDGFTGNVIIKLAEGLGEMLKAFIREELQRDLLSMVGGLLARRAFDRVSARTAYSAYGGAPLLGVDGVVIIGHGRSNPEAVKNGVRVAKTAAEQGVVPAIRDGLRDVPNT